MIQRSVWFTAPGEVQICERELSAPGEGQVLVKTKLSAISTGTERLVFLGQAPAELALDDNIAALPGSFQYPFSYGYCLVGEVTALGPGVDRAWLGKRVFSFHPHADYFNASPAALLVVPEEMSPERAVFFANMETAVNFIQDGRPMLGENVAVFGLGIVGLLTAALLLRFPVQSYAFDLNPQRRAAAGQMGLNAAAPGSAGDGPAAQGFDLGYELSGSPAALDELIAHMRFSGRVIIGSWYGAKPAVLALGGRFHRSRIELISSQVSSIHPSISGRWDKQRRYEQVWRQLGQIRPEKWISHRFVLGQAAAAYHLIAYPPDEFIQAVFTYPD